MNYFNNIPRFGPAGNSDGFYNDGKKATIEAFEWLSKKGLNAYEYQCGHGVRVGEKLSLEIGAEAKKFGVAVSLHAPYYISLASAEMEKRDNSINYILQSAKAVKNMGGSRIVVHPGGLGKMSREDATAAAAETLLRAQNALDENGFHDIHLCLETMGKINQLGNLDEVLHFCTLEERFLPCIDFGHLNARTLGEVNSYEAFAEILDKVENVAGSERARNMHVHFSKIEYSKGGEKKHLTFSDDIFGPEPRPLIELFAKRNYTPFIICESDGTQDVDAIILKQLFQSTL